MAITAEGLRPSQRPQPTAIVQAKSMVEGARPFAIVNQTLLRWCIGTEGHRDSALCSLVGRQTRESLPCHLAFTDPPWMVYGHSQTTTPARRGSRSRTARRSIMARYRAAFKRVGTGPLCLPLVAKSISLGLMWRCHTNFGLFY